MSGLTDEQLDDLYRRWLQKTSFTHLTTHVASLLAAARAEGAEKALLDARAAVYAESGIQWGRDDWREWLRIRAALTGGERDE